jgi:hypothetical protein
MRPLRLMGFSPSARAACDVCEAHLDELLHERLRQGTIDREVYGALRCRVAVEFIGSCPMTEPLNGR